MARELTVVLVGATGVVGAEFLRLFDERSTPIKELRLLATKRSAGREISFRGTKLRVEETMHAAFDGADVAFISATTAASQELCPVARDRGAIAFDDSSAWRMDDSVPLVVPEINGADLRDHQGIIATPNCSTVPLAQTLYPLMQVREVRRVVADTYQSASGAGAALVHELRQQTAAVLAGDPVNVEQAPKQLAFNAIPQIDVFGEDGYTKEETKMVNESRKILHTPDLAISTTCVRIPTLVSHAVAVHVELDRPLDPAEARELWAAQDGVTVLDDPLNGVYPTPLESTAQDDVFVGRARRDASHPNGLVYWCVTDNLVKGAALNMIQMVEWMQEDGIL